MKKQIFEKFNPKEYIKKKEYKEYLCIDNQIEILFSKKEEKFNFDIDVELFIDPLIKDSVKQYIDKQFSNHYITQPIYMLKLKNAFIYQRTTLTPRHLLLTVGNKYITSLLSSKSLHYYKQEGLIELLSDDRIVINHKIKADVIIHNDCLFLHSFSNLYHILMEVVPNLIFEKNIDMNNFVFLLYGNEKNMLEKMLNLLGFKNKTIKLDNLNVKVKNLYFPSFQTFGHISEPRKESLFFPQKLTKLLDIDKKYKHIYISRNDAHQRLTINEENVMKMLEKYDFELITPGKYSIEDQIKIFSNAKYIIAPHGMGITNILFCKNEFTLVEIFADGWVRNFYYRIVQLLHGKYRGVFSPSINKNNDLNIEVDILENILRKDFKL